jgi:hypothetical protein
MNIAAPTASGVTALRTNCERMEIHLSFSHLALPWKEEMPGG